MSHVEAVKAVQFRSNIAAEDLLDLPDGLWDLLPVGVYVCDRAGLIRRYNLRAAELWGREPKLGDPAERFSGFHRLYRPDGGPLRPVQSPMADVLRSGTPIRDQEVMIERPDGSRIIASANLDVLRDETGRIVGAVSCFQDISERKRVEEDVRSSRRDLEDFFENSVAAMHLVAADGTILRANQAELDLLGYRREEYVGHHIAEFHAERATIDDILARLSRGEKLDKYPARLLAKGGSIKHVIVSSSVQFRDGEFVNTRCITLDMTAERAAEAALRDAASARAMPDGRGAEGGPAVRGEEAIAERPDGTRVPFIPYPTPLHDDSGALVGAVNMLVDISERKASEEKLRESELRLSTELVAVQRLQEVSAELVHEQDIEALYQKLVNAAAAIMASDCASMQLLHPERGENGELQLLASLAFTPQAAQFWEWVRADSGCSCGMAMRTGQRAIASDVATCDFMAGTEDQKSYLAAGMHAVQSTPLIGRTGCLLGMISTHWREPHVPPDGNLARLDILARLAADLIERNQAEEQQRLLLREMSHRVKNLCAVASGVVALSARSAQSPQDMAVAVQRRLAALTRAHDLIRPAITEAGEIGIPDTTLDALVRAIFEPYIDPNQAEAHECLIARGPPVAIGGSSATGLALLLHELATNAAKYGALSRSEGAVEINWSVESDKLVLDWTERGGPPINGPPDHEGFGSLLARRSITGQLGGQLTYDWRPDGLALKISIARDRLGA